MCRRERDAQIFTAIKNWETEKLLSKELPTVAAKKDYIDKLETEKAEL